MTTNYIVVIAYFMTESAASSKHCMLFKEVIPIIFVIIYLYWSATVRKEITVKRLSMMLYNMYYKALLY